MTTTTNLKTAAGNTKPKVSSLPWAVIIEMGLAAEEGAIKYSTYNWRTAGCTATDYWNAAMRHMMSWWEGEDLDPDSGLPHLTKAAVTIAMLRDSERIGNMEDDRPPHLESNDFIAEFCQQKERMLNNVNA